MRRATRDLHALATRVASPAELGQVLSQALHALRRVIAYDLAAIYRLDGQILRVVAAEGPLATPEVRAHTLDLKRFPTIRRALAQRSPVPLEAHHHASDEGDPYDGVLDLPDGHSCMVVPLFAGDEDLGIITLDRSLCAVYPDTDVELAGIYGQLVSLAIRFAEQAEQLDRYRHQLEVGRQMLVEDAGGGSRAVRRLEASQTPAMRALVEQGRRVAASPLPVLIHGETGVGKELLAHALHAWSARAEGPFLAVNCAAIPDNLVESELFGHAKGAFSGAVEARPGRFQAASGGTLFLDEVGELPPGTQAKLLRVLQDSAVTPVGVDRPVPVDVRIVSASHIDLKAAVQDGRFREDLYYRLAVVPLTVPPLRERPQDILDIATELLDGLARGGRGPWTLPEDTRRAMGSHPWPGNVRELRNAIERASVLAAPGPLTRADLGLGGDIRPPTAPGAGTTQAIGDFATQETDYFRRLLEATGGKIYGDDGAAALAGLKPTTLQSKLKKRGLK